MKVVLMEGGIAPKRVYEGAAAYDLYTPDSIDLDVGLTSIPIKVKIQLPTKHMGWIACRSSFACTGVSVEGGIIDTDYTGELIVLLRNHSGQVLRIPKARAIAQLIVLKYETPEIEIVDSLEDTQRGERGFGSSNK